MLAMPSSQTGRRAKVNTSRTSKPVVWLLLAPMRWHTEDAAVHRLAATASKIAVSISLFLPGTVPPMPSLKPWPASRPELMAKIVGRQRYGIVTAKAPVCRR